jgi:hypothetical protein
MRLVLPWRGQGSVVETEDSSRFTTTTKGVGPITPLEKLLEKRAAAAEELEGILRDPETGEPRETLTDEQEARSTELLADIPAFDEEIAKVSKEIRTQNMLAEARSLVTRSEASDARVVDEPKVYGTGSPDSYYADMITIDRKSPLDPRYRMAVDRTMRWSDQVEREVAEGTEFGKSAESRLREVFRDGDPLVTHRILTEVRERGRVALKDKQGGELRAINSGGGPTVATSGGAASFITPVFATPYIPFREYGRAFADQAAKGDLPDFGLAIYKPQITSQAAVAQFTEGSAVQETDPTAGYQVATLAVFAGEVTVSQVVLDRMAPDYRFDVAMEDQLHRDYDPKFDRYTLAQALVNATSQSWTGNAGSFEMVAHTLPGSGGFYGQVSLAKANMRKLLGTVLNPTHLFADPSLYEFMAAWADTTGRPLVVPDYAGPFNALANSGTGDAGIEGYTGTRFNGLPYYTDANIPTTGGTLAYYQAIVACMAEGEVYEGAPINRVLPQTNATLLETILQRYSYAAVFVNYPGAVTTINGTGFSGLSYNG